ncbi:MAG: lipopolysaccharide biosynthesis protein [Ginsengibacter sp.]
MSYFLVSLFGMIELSKSRMLKIAIYKTELAEIIKICGPQIIHLLSGVILALSDRFVIQRYLGNSSVGIYSAYYTLGMGAVILIDGITRVWSPQTYKLLNDENAKSHTEISVVIQGIAITFVTFLAVYMACIYLLQGIILAKPYLGLFPIFVLVVLGYFFQGLYKLMFPIFIHFSRSGTVATINAVGAFINLALCILLINKYGLYGIAFATLIAFMLIAVSMYIYLRKFFNLQLFGPIQIKRFLNALRDSSI